jgi:hypothetical protein
LFSVSLTEFPLYKQKLAGIPIVIKSGGARLQGSCYVLIGHEFTQLSCLNYGEWRPSSPIGGMMYGK